MKKKNIEVAILTGSRSDLPVVKKAGDVLEKFGIGYGLTITSAHRSLKNTIKIVEDYEKNGVEVFIVCAGASAHLAGVAAALTCRPVIGVPVGSSVFKGLDSLFSVVQMPPGVPVAAVGVNSSANAAILAAEILAAGDGILKGKLAQYKRGLAKKIIADNKNYKKGK